MWGRAWPLGQTHLASRQLCWVTSGKSLCLSEVPSLPMKEATDIRGLSPLGPEEDVWGSGCTCHLADGNSVLSGIEWSGPGTSLLATRPCRGSLGKRVHCHPEQGQLQDGEPRVGQFW